MANRLVSSIWRINRSANRLLIVSTNLDAFNLANHGRFAKFAKLSCYTVYQLEWYGIRGNTNHWISSFLNNCTQRVVLGGVSSPEYLVLSGVPQGTVLGPTLFRIYINGLPETIVYSSVKLFADDCVLYKAIRTHDDVEKLEEDLSAFQDWQQKWLMKLNVSKCYML